MDAPPTLARACALRGLPTFSSAGSYLGATLMNINALFHPAIVCAQFERWDGVSPYKIEKPFPFYEGATQEGAGQLIEQLSKECVTVKEAIRNVAPDIDLHTVLHIRDYFKNAYGDDIADNSSMACALNTNKGYRGLTHAMKQAAGGGGLVPDWSTRYLAEDLPYGLVPIKGLAQCLGVSTPVLDSLIEWCQQRMGKEYIVDGALSGKDVGETRCPQRYGFRTIEDVLSLSA
jgi:hypothetical protein